jgi:hypothetical protein
MKAYYLITMLYMLQIEKSFERVVVNCMLLFMGGIDIFSFIVSSERAKLLSKVNQMYG